LTGSVRNLAPLGAVATVLLAGCGGGAGGPHMARRDAAPLIELADRIAREAPCAQARDIRAFRARTIALVNARRVPPALQESLTSGMNALVEPPCLPAVPKATSPTTTVAPEHGKKHEHDHHGHGKAGD
jgi:hypothetical protein